jgi:hypothetical protein
MFVGKSMVAEQIRAARKKAAPREKQLRHAKK